MIEVVSITELDPGDIILICWPKTGDIDIVTVDGVREKTVHILEYGGSDVVLPDMDQIVRIGTFVRKPEIQILASLKIQLI